jgi:2-amino-4-hydroxy-6-hydroxymethyldihydropteridine diphosphokinase
VSRHIAYIGIGTNLGDRFEHARNALASLASLGSIARRSSFYRTQPVGKTDQPWFLNAVVALETSLPPQDLLAGLQSIERAMGRVRAQRWGPRTIDLDLLFYDQLEIDEPNLRVPHPNFHERAFVLVPLAEIDARFAPLRDALGPAQLAGVVRAEREGLIEVSSRAELAPSERVRALARFLGTTDAVRVRIERGDDVVEVAAGAQRVPPTSRPGERSLGDGTHERVDTIKADLVGIFRVGRPAPAEGEAFEGDRELGYIEALGIRTPIHSMGPGRLLSVAANDGAAVEYGQPLFLVGRGR